MKKKVFIFLFCFLSIMFLSGCSFVKKALTVEEFSKIAKDNDLNVLDAKEYFADNNDVVSATVALSTDEWQLEYYVLDNSSNAKNMFNKNKKAFEASKENNSKKDSMMEIFNYSKYTLESNSNYMVAIKVSNTFLYVNVPIQYKSNVDSIIKAMNY